MLDENYKCNFKNKAIDKLYKECPLDVSKSYFQKDKDTVSMYDDIS
jgi:hypothetical protein